MFWHQLRSTTAALVQKPFQVGDLKHLPDQRAGVGDPYLPVLVHGGGQHGGQTAQASAVHRAHSGKIDD